VHATRCIKEYCLNKRLTKVKRNITEPCRDRKGVSIIQRRKTASDFINEALKTGLLRAVMQIHWQVIKLREN
jgi:hypothetical protein